MIPNGLYRPSKTLTKAATSGVVSGASALAALAAAAPGPIAQVDPSAGWPALVISIIVAAARAFLNWRKHRHRPRRRLSNSRR